MVSVWWLLWAFLVGGYAGMLIIALAVIAHEAGAGSSAFE